MEGPLGYARPFPVRTVDLHVDGFVDDSRVEPAERLDVVPVQVHVLQYGVHADDALVKLRPSRQGVGGGVEGTQPQLGVPSDGKDLIHVRAGEAGSDRERLGWCARRQGE